MLFDFCWRTKGQMCPRARNSNVPLWNTNLLFPSGVRAKLDQETFRKARKSWASVSTVLWANRNGRRTAGEGAFSVQFKAPNDLQWCSVLWCFGCGGFHAFISFLHIQLAEKTVVVECCRDRMPKRRIYSGEQEKFFLIVWLPWKGFSGADLCTPVWRIFAKSHQFQPEKQFDFDRPCMESGLLDAKKFMRIHADLCDSRQETVPSRTLPWQTTDLSQTLCFFFLLS